jgi:hypothetical protein
MSYMSPSVCDEKGMCLYRLPDVEPIVEIKNESIILNIFTKHSNKCISKHSSLRLLSFFHMDLWIFKRISLLDCK